MVNWRIIPVSKWLITMVIVSPLRIGWFPLPMAFSWLLTSPGIPSSKYTQIIENPLPSQCRVAPSNHLETRFPTLRGELKLRGCPFSNTEVRIKSGICFQGFQIGGFFRWHFLLGPSAYFQGCLRLVKGREVYGSLIPITMKNPEIPSLLYLSVGTSWQPIWKLTLCIFSRDAHIIWIHSMTSRNKKFTRQKKPGEFTAGSLIIFTQFAQIRLLRSPGFFN